MKKLIILSLVLLMSQFLNSQSIEGSKKLGFVSYLTSLKMHSEHKMLSLASDPKYKSDNEDVLLSHAEYNKLKITVDRVLNQLVADMTSKNRLKEYKNINKYIRGEVENLPSELIAYQKAFESIDDMYLSFILFSFKEDSPGFMAPSIEEILGVAAWTSGLITSARDFRQKKVSNICLQIQELRFSSIKDLTKEEED